MIVIIGPAHPYRGGIADTNESLAYTLLSQGHDVKIFTFSRMYPNALFPGKTQFSSKEKPYDLDIERTIDSLRPKTWVATSKMINKLSPSLIIFRYWTPFLSPCLGTIARLLKSFTRIAIVDNAKGHEPKMGESALLRYFLGSQDGLLSFSKNVTQQLQRKTQKTIVTHPHPVNQGLPSKIEKSRARTILGLNKNAPVLLFFGLLRKYKGIEVLIDAIAELRGKLPNVQLLIVGEAYTSIEPYLKKIKTLDLENNISFHTSYIEDKDVSVWFSASDCVVQPYQSASQSGITPMALHFHRPMVVTDVGGLAEGLAPPVAKIVSPYAHAIANGIFSVINENIPEEKDFEEYLEQRSWKKFAKKMTAFAQSL
jgi:D-inositol-3-phosphate glycosyltransferase